MILGRDRIYAATLALTLAAITAFGIFIYRDYQDGQAVKFSVTNSGPVAGGPAANAADAGTGGVATPGAGGTPAQGGSSNTVVGGSAGSAGSAAKAGSAGGVSGAATQQGCKNGAIKIGQIVPLSGPVTQQTAADAVDAYFADVNANGGINGCKVDFTYRDDSGTDQQKAKAAAVELVQEQQVFAFVGNVEPVTTASTEPYFEQRKIPVIGVEGVGINEYNEPVEYSFAEAPEGFGISCANYLKKVIPPEKLGNVALFYLAFDFGDVSAKGFVDQMHAILPNTTVQKFREDISSQSYSTDTLQARTNGAKVVVNIMDANSVIREFDAMKSNAYFPDVVATTSTSDPVVNNAEHAWLDDPQHKVYVQRNYLPADAATPEVQQWIRIQQKYHADGFDPNSYAEGAWLGAKVFTELARKLGSNLTRQGLFDAMNSLRGYHTGFTPDLTMTADHEVNKQVLWLTWSAQHQKYDQITQFQPW